MSSLSYACRPTVPTLERDLEDDTTTSDGTTMARGSTSTEGTGLEGSGSGGMGSSGTGSSGTSLGAIGSSDTGTSGSSGAGTTSSPADGLESSGAVLVHDPEVGDLIFSEYVEGTGNHKALEIYATSDHPVALDSCEIRLYSNESQDVVVTLPLKASDPMGGHDVFLVCQASMDPLATCDQLTLLGLFSGDDAIELACGGVTLDTFGEIGPQPPDLEWWNQPVPTTAVTLRRDCGVITGDADGHDSFDPGLEWDPFPVDDFSDLGQRNCP